MTKPPIDRVLTRTVEDPNSGCWNFQGALNNHGYGYVGSGGHQGRKLYVHRATFEFFVDEIPSGLVLDHLCRNPKCCNPWHLEPVTQRENLRRGRGFAGLNAQKDACPQGHPYVPGNINWSKDGYRACLECKKLGQREYRARKRAERGAA